MDAKEFSFGQIIKMWMTKKACHHKWKTYHRTEMTVDNLMGYEKYTVDTVVCKKCGKINKIKL